MRLLKSSVIFAVVVFTSTVKGILEAHIATEKQFPYHAFIRTCYSDLNIDYIDECSGALIKHQFVITSASCVLLGKLFKITFGSLNAIEDTDTYITEIPPYYKDEIALLQLETSITFNDRIQPIAIPNLYDRLEYLTPKSIVGNVTGYNDDKPRELMWISAAIYQRNDKELLLDYKDGDFCMEQGLPLVIFFNNEKILYAIRDYDRFQCDTKFVTIIPPYLNFIHKTINENKRNN